MKNKDLVSVVIPAYNQAIYLANAVESVLRQTYNHFEIIVVDDGSTDNTHSVIEKYKEQILYIWQENQGLAGARNTGLRNASGSLICLLDADDEWSPQYLERMTKLAMEDPGAAVYYCCAQAIDGDGKILPQVFGCHEKQPSEIFSTLLRLNFIIPSTVMMNYASIESQDFFDENFRRLQDWELWLRLLKQGYYFRYLPEVLVNYRIHEESLSVDVGGGHRAVMEMVGKHFGTDDNKPKLWTQQKRRAYGGAYRYQCITFVQRQNNWDACLPLMKKALQIDSSLALDINFFFELALGAQPMGYRGVSHLQSFDENSFHLMHLVHQSVDSLLDQTIRKQALGTVYLALGLASYNLGTRSMFRKYFLRALIYRPELLLDVDLVARYFKSFLSKTSVEKYKKLVGLSL